MKKKMRWLTVVAATVLLASCCKTVDESAWQQKMKQAAELGTVQYTVQKVVSNNDESWKIFGDRKILFSFKAVIKAGIDMEKFDPQSVRVSENKRKGTKKVSLELPQPKIFTYNIRPEDVKLLQRGVVAAHGIFQQGARRNCGERLVGAEDRQGVDGNDIEGRPAECRVVCRDVAAPQRVHQCRNNI